MTPLSWAAAARRTASVVVAGLVLAGCGSSGDGEGGAADPDPTGTPTATSGSAPATFLKLTAEHLCAVQDKVYPDAAALADAYETAPDYPGVDPTEVRRLTRRLETDRGFARDLNDRITDTCGEDGPQG